MKLQITSNKSQEQMKTHKDLDAWKKAIALVTEIYSVTKEFPSEEKFGIVNQIRRSAVSIPSNIAEGAARQSNREYIQFLYIALGSTAELETQLIIASNLNYIDALKFEALSLKLETISKLIVGLIKYVKSKL